MSSQMPLVSIVTPSFNQGRFLEATIRSILDQSYKNIEYMVIDGGSKDKSIEILQQYSDRISYWVSEPDRGQAHAINKGLARARGSFLGWVNSDDVLFPETIEHAVQAFIQNPSVDVVYGRLERIDENDRLVPTPILPKDRLEFSRKNILGECIINQPGSFWRRKIMETAGLLDESLNYALDYEYWIRLALVGARFKRMPDVAARFRLSSSSKTVSQTAAMAREQLKVLEEVAERPNLSKELGLSTQEIERQVRYTKARICLHGFYGDFKSRKWRSAQGWLKEAILNDPLSIFDRRWLALAWARIRR